MIYLATGEPGALIADAYLVGVLIGAVWSVITAAQYLGECRAADLEPDWGQGPVVGNRYPGCGEPFASGLMAVAVTFWPVVAFFILPLYFVCEHAVPWLWHRALGAPWRILVGFFERRARAQTAASRSLAERERASRNYLDERLATLRAEGATDTPEYFALSSSREAMT